MALRPQPTALPAPGSPAHTPPPGVHPPSSLAVLLVLQPEARPVAWARSTARRVPAAVQVPALCPAPPPAPGPASGLTSASC